MKVSFTELAWSDYLWLQKDKRLLERVNLLIKDVMRNAFEGIGKPEPLKGNLSGYWSRRIDGEHRLVYQVFGDEILIVSCRFHYER